jgi:hypothetical protein
LPWREQENWQLENGKTKYRSRKVKLSGAQQEKYYGGGNE